MTYRNYIRSYENFPKSGVTFWDFTELLKDPQIFERAIEDIRMHFNSHPITKIVAIEAKGFIIGSLLAYKMQKPLVLIRKPGLIPGQIRAIKFIKEYGEGEFEIRKGTVNEKDNVLIVYDILARSGATEGAIQLIEDEGGQVAGCAFIIELKYLQAREQLKNYHVFSLVKEDNP